MITVNPCAEDGEQDVSSFFWGRAISKDAGVVMA
jgi:hypothetical protein